MKANTTSAQHGQSTELRCDALVRPPAFRENTEIDECDVICPHCGEAYQAEGEDFSENEREETCESCGGRYVLYDQFTVTHHTRALPNTGDEARPGAGATPKEKTV